VSLYHLTASGVVTVGSKEMLQRLAPLQSGRETEIDMIEREMEGGVVVEQSPSVHEHYIVDRLGGLVEIEEHVEARKRKP
jgi:hypothetical protein